MAERPLYTLYKNLKAQNYDVPDDYNKFESALTRDGKGGADNRHAIYENLKAQNFDVPNTYERFYSALFEPRSKTSSRAKGGSVPMSAADRARFSARTAAISASANNAARQAKRNIQTKLGQAKKFNGGRVSPRLKNPLQNQNVQKNEFNYNSTTGKNGTYTTTDGVEFDNEYDATQYQNKLDKYGEEWSKAVGMGMVPSELDKADPDLSDTDVAMRQMERRQEWLNENQDRRSKELNESMHLQGSPFVASGGAVAPSSFNTAISNEANRLSDVEYGAYNTAKAYNQMLRTTLLQELKEQKQRNENAGWLKDKWNDVSNYFGAMFNTMLDPKLYSQGVMDAAIANNLLQVKKGMEDGTIKKGSNAGNAAQAMLGAIQQQQGEAAKQQQYGTKAYQYGDMSGRSLKFLGDFLLSGWRNVMTTGFTKAGEKVGEKMALGALGKWFTKNTGRVLGDMAGSAALAATNQLGSTYNNVIERYVGMNNENGGVTQDKNGDLKFNEGVSLGKAIKDGFGSATIENFSEMFGEYLPGAPKLLSKLGLSKVSSFFEKIGNNAYYKWLSNATNKSGIQGVMAEISEEEFGTALHAAWGDGDGSWSDFNVFTNPDAREKQIDTCLGMFYSVGFMHAPRTAIGAINAALYFNIKHQVAKADKFGQMMFNDKWEDIKSKIDVTTNADLTKTVLEATRSDSMTAKQKGAVINYAMFLSKLRGFNQASDAKTKDKVEEGDTAPTLSNDLDDAYTEGHNADDADKHNIQLEQNDKANELAAMLHITPEQLHDMADEDLETMTGQDDKLDKAIYDYQVSTAKYQGVMDGAQDEVDMAAHQAAMETDNMTDLSRGTVRKATIKATGGLEDYEVYIISGNIATHDDGSIDVGNSDDMIIYYDPTTGRKEHADAMMFADLIEELPAADVKAQAVADAKENAIKKIAGIVDGTIDVGSQFSVTDVDGTEHTYEVLADNGDGTAMITIDGNVPTELVKGENVQIPYSFADLQQLKDAEDLKRLEAAKTEREQMEKERAEQTQETEQTEEIQPSFDFNQILNDNGNVVLADVLGKDGNTKYPNSQLFLIRDSGAKAKVMELKSDGTLVPHAVNKKDVRTATTMTLDEYKQAFADSSMIEENSGAIEGDRGGIEVNDELPPVPDNVTINGDGTYSVDGAVQGGENTTAPAEQTEQTPAMTLEDGTIVPMLEDGNPDFSKLTADQTAELYDTQFGDDADSVISGWVSDAKKALDKANNMTVKGKNFVEQKAAKEAKEKAIADAQTAYDSAIAIRDAYNSRQLAKVEDTAEGRKNLIEKARRKFSRLKSAVKDDAEAVSQLYKDVVGSLLHRLYDGTGIDVTDTIPLTAEEYVASNLGAHSLNYEGTETSKGVKQETGLSREDFAKTQLLAADGKGTTIDDLVHSLWENRPSNLESLDTQDIRNALIGVLNSGFKASEARNYIENLRIAQAENILEEQKKAADNAAFADDNKAESEQQTETAPESEEKTGEDNSDEINDEENEQTNAPEQNNFPDKLREGSKAIEVPEDATDEKPLGEQRTKSPFLVRENGKQQTETESDADVEKNKVDDMKVVDNIVGEKTRKTLEKIAKIMGANVQWLYSNEQFNGKFDEKTNTIYLTLDSSIIEGVQFIFGHEMTHEMRTKNPAAYDELKTLVKDMMGEDAFNSETDKMQIRYKKGGARYWNNRNAIEEEVVADQLGKWIRDANYAHTLLLKMSHPLLAKLHEIVNSFLMALHGTEFSDDMRLILRSIEQAYVKTANGQVMNTETGEDVSYSLRQKPEPKKKGVGYKVFVLKDGKLYPPMVANPDGAATPVGVWLDADAAPIAGESKTGRPQVKQGGKGTQGGSGKLAYRPGWHLGVVPYAIQFNRKDADGNKTLFPKNFVFAEVEYAADVDYQEEARQEGINPSGKYQHSLAGLKHLPTDGYYMYRTNPNPETDPWVITGAMKVNRILTRAEQAELVKNAGREPQQIQEGDIVTDDVVNSINQEIADAPKFSLKVYHGSGADFTEFDFDHMGEGEGSQAFGWGGYVTSSKKIGKNYSTLMDNDPSRAYYRIQHSNGTRFAKKYPTLESFLHGDKQIAMNDKFTEQEKIDYYNEMKKLAEPYHNLYEVDIPDDNGSNYLDWDAPITDELIDKVAKALPSLRSYDIKDLKKDRTFDNFYKTISMRSVTDDASFNDDKAASKLFSSLGYTGIKYKAGRNFGGAEEGDTNYVIFKPEDMKITEHTKFSLKSKPVRFEAGKKLSDEEKKEVLSTLKDAYKVNGVPYHIEETAGGKEKRVYEPTADSYVVSDITNRPLRYYITLPDGRVAHPTEVYPNISDNEVKSSATKQGLLDDEADQIVSAAIGNMKDIADNAKAVEVLTELQNLPHETHDVGYGLNNAKSYNYKTGIFTSDAAQAIDYVVRRMRRKEDVPAEIPAALKMAVADSYGMVDNLIDGMINTKVGAAEIKPVGVGAFGNIYNQFRGKAKAAIEFLKKLGSGEAAAALQHHTIGDISLVWGDKKTGLDKILRKHPEVVDNLQSIIDSMEVVQESDNRIKLESPTHFAVVSKEYKGEPREQWLLTAYEKRESLENGKSMDTATSSLGGDTALSQSKESAAKIDNSSETAKENGEKFSLKDEKIKSVAEKFGVNEDDVAMYANAVERGSTAEAARARANIKRYLLQANEDKISSFKDIIKYTKPINEALKENFGDLDAMIEERRKQVEAQRNAMEAARKRAQEEEEKRQKHLDELSLIPTDELDKRYMDAIANNDESTAREMLDESARRNGYGDVDSDYQGQGAWAAPSNPQYESDEARRADIENSPDVNLEDIALGYNLQPDDYFDNPRAYMNNTAYGLESAHVIKNALDAIKNGEKDVKVKVYRAVPTSVKEGKLRNGDWVTPSKKYAEMHGDNRLDGKYRIIEDEVPANQLWWDGNDVNEFGFDDGKEYRYKNAKNNRKLNDLITYDNKGNVIPPSKRFNSRKSDIRFSLKAMMEKPEGWKQANKKAIHVAEAIERDPKFSLKNLDGTLIKAGTYFSGGGLVEEGLKGIIDPVVAVEYDEKISGVYRNNFGQHIVTADVRDVDPKELVKQIDGEVEYFHASPVCKNYSQAKSNHTEVELDKETAASTAEFINSVKPKVVTIENVKGYKDSDAMKIITDALDANGYTWDADVYNAADYGGYTNRERLIVRAVRDGKLPEKPKKMAHKSGWYEAVADIIPTLTEKKNGVANWMDIRLKADGIDWRNIDKPLYVMGSAYADGKIPHAFADELLPTLRTKSGDVIVMPDGKVYRAMGRVLARVSGVSDDYKMPFSENLSHTIIGNGIPTQLTEHVIAPLLQNTLHPTTPEDGNTKFSLRYDKFEHDLNQWKKDNNLPKDAQRPTIPQRNAGESAVDFLRRVDEYRKQMALWKTAPTYEQHLLSDDSALGEFNRELQRGSVLKRIAFQDSMLAIRKAQEAIMKEVGVDRLNMAEDAYTAENRSHGKGKNEFEEYNNEFLQPLRKAYHQMKKVLGDSYDNVRVYMMAKHGLERDAQMAFKKSLEADYEDVNQRSAAYKAYKNDLGRVSNDADLEFGRVDFTTWRQKDNALRGKYSPSYMDYRYDENGIVNDYSGLSQLFGGSDFEEAAHKLVRDVETKHLAEVQTLWNATNAATKKILRDGFKAGMMSKDTYEYVKGMYSHYIPLRGWDGTTADQVWDYIGGGKGAFNQTLKTAHGRTSIADDPIAYIENMAESGILLNNKNWVKQHLMLLAQNHPTSLLTLSKAWYVKSTDANGNEEWIPATPQITFQMNSNQVKAAIDAFEQKMEQLAQTGDATQQRDGLNIAYPQTHSEEREHEVRVMKDGEEYVIYVNGDPQLAQAMNNTRAHRVREIQSGKLDRAAAWLGRKMAAAYTSLSPLFIPSNYFRDLTMILASTAIREDGRYNYLLRKNLATSWNLGFMLKDYQNGKLREKVSNGNATKKEQMFYDFMMNGGETGFVSSLDVEDLKKKFKNDLKDLDRWKANPVKVGHTIMDSIEFLNRMIEDSNRFAVYMTSIQYGRSIDEAVNDAKDVTLNFNRKGTGEYGWQMIRNLYLFINPAVQSLQTLGALTKHHPFKFTAVTAAWLASGVLVPIVNAALMSLLGGDDDKDKYWQFSKWDRRNNAIMWIPFTNEYVKIPLAQEFRAFYGIGDMIASKMMGGELAEETWSQYAEDLLGQVVDMLPLDPTGYDGNIAVSLMPNPIRPVFELAFNVDFTGKPLFKETEYNKYDPNFTKAYVGTPDWLVRVSKMVNSIGNDYPDVQQNAIDAFGDPRYSLNNPAVVDHVLSSYLGGAYTMGSQVLGVLTKSLNDPKEIKMADIPLVSKFVSNPDDRPVTKKQGDEFWNMKENHDRAANTLSKLKKQAKVDGDYSMLERFYGSEEYKQYKQEDVKVKKYEEDKKKERAEESGEEYRPHKLNAEDIYKAHATPKDDFEDLKLKQLYTKLNGFKTSYDLLVDTAPSQSDGYYNTNKVAIDAIDEISIDKQEISELKKGFLDDGKDAYNAEDMKRIRELRKRILSVLEPANKVVVANQKAKAEK